MRKAAFTILLAPFTVAVLYACVSESDTSAPASPDSGITPTPTSTTTSTTTPTGTTTNQPPSDSGPDTAQPFTPSTLGNRLVLWLDADRGFSIVDGGVTWKDQSPEGNDAKQDDQTRQPIHVDGGTFDAGTHGVLRFNANEYLQIADDPTLQWGTTDYALYAVMRHTNDPAGAGKQAYGIVYAKWTDTSPFPGMFLWANYPNGDVKNGYTTRTDEVKFISTDAGYNDGVLRVVGVRKTGDKLELRVNGKKENELADAGGYDASAFSAPGLPAYIGGRPAAFQALVGDIAEIVAIKGAVSDSEQANVESFLKTRHGL